ncbi:uncharacterized protein LOC109815348 [Cajanus cajan]|uniref:Uncharacterized protein n=1 Tax=Cajanus cajan TaxID=3821 RepID=A0A151RW60_CAJCA|nr:uncharacterized protein LOC109815348 [Cajanus cajan]KYP46771.1 hypothetical protein KK1_031612 [Cajanus cajan]
MQNSINRQHSLREKLKSSICCFTGHEPLEQGEGLYSKFRIPRTPISPSGSTSSSSWFKLRSPTAASTEFAPRVRGRSLKSRMGRKFLHRQSQSADFSYDPSSYALNFENESPHDHELPFRNFSSRLPASPPPVKCSDSDQIHSF